MRGSAAVEEVREMRLVGGALVGPRSRVPAEESEAMLDDPPLDEGVRVPAPTSCPR